MANLGAPMPAGITTPQDLAVALRYGPNTEQALRRSSYLTDALRQLNAEGSQNIHSGGELAAKLLAAAILNRKAGSSQDAVMSAMRADQGAETANSMAGLRPAPTGEAPTGAAPSLVAPQEAPPPIPTPQPQPDAAPAPVQQAPQPSPTQSAYSPADRDALIKMGAVEAGGEGPSGIAAAMHVALNRLRSGYGGAKSLYDVIHQPHQFTGIQNGDQPDPRAVALASQVADGVLGGQVADPTNGAQAFLNPELTQRLYGRIPAWAQGNDGHRIGRHVFFGGQAAPPQIAQAGGQPPLPPPPPGQDVPVETAAAGADPFPASAPGTSSPPAAGAAPAGVSPQAPPAGALPPNWPRWKPSPDKLAYVESLLNDPRHHAEGVALADQYRQKMLEPVEAQITMINGAPFYIPKDPTEGVPSMAVPIPAAAMTHIASAESLHLSAPPGTTFSVDPLNNPKQLTAPAAGQMVTSAPGQPYKEGFIPGGVNDPTRPQAPAAGFQYAPGAGGAQAVIPGSAADPRAPMNIAAAAERLQGAIRPTIDLARDARQSVEQVDAGAQLQNGSGDLAMLKGLNQLIAHGVVRPADMDAQLKSDGVAGTLGELTQFLTSNGKLTPEARAKTVAAAHALYAPANQQFKSQVLSHRATTDAIYGDGAFDKYVFPAQQAQDLGWAEAPHAPGGAAPPPPLQPHLTPGSREAAIAEARKRGLAVK